MRNIQPEEIISQFKYDKKGDGKSVPLILINNPGDVIFYRYFFNSQSNELVESIKLATNEFIEWATI